MLWGLHRYSGNDEVGDQRVKRPEGTRLLLLTSLKVSSNSSTLLDQHCSFSPHFSSSQLSLWWAWLWHGPWDNAWVQAFRVFQKYMNSVPSSYRRNLKTGKSKVKVRDALWPTQSAGRGKKCSERSSLCLFDGYGLVVWTCWQSSWTLKNFLPPVPIPEAHSFFLLWPLFNRGILLLYASFWKNVPCVPCQCYKKVKWNGSLEQSPPPVWPKGELLYLCPLWLTTGFQERALEWWQCCSLFLWSRLEVSETLPKSDSTNLWSPLH